jgi:hypothetical protein
MERFSAVLVYGTVEAQQRGIDCIHCLQRGAKAHAAEGRLGHVYWTAKSAYFVQVRHDLGVPEPTPPEEAGCVITEWRSD